MENRIVSFLALLVGALVFVPVVSAQADRPSQQACTIACYNTSCTIFTGLTRCYACCIQHCNSDDQCNCQGCCDRQGFAIEKIIAANSFDRNDPTKSDMIVKFLMGADYQLDTLDDDHAMMIAWSGLGCNTTQILSKFALLRAGERLLNASMSNTASSELKSFVRFSLDSSNPSIRTSAVIAVAGADLLKENDFVFKLMEMSAQDADTEVRDFAVRCLNGWRPEF